MKTLVHIFIFATGCLSVKAQYHPMLDNSSWIVHIIPFIEPDPYDDIIHQGSDVVIGQNTYKQIYDPVYNQQLFFREDVVEQKVYQLVDGVEQIVFDFSLQLSDTITFENGITYTVTSVTNIEGANGTRKAIELNSILNQEYWIEGVGSFRHPLISHIVLSEPDVKLNCSYQNGLNIYSSWDSNCESSLKRIETQNQSAATVTPTPFSNEATITLTQNLSNGSLKVFNQLGELVREAKNLNGKNLNMDRGNLKAGLYIMQIFENNEMYICKKIMIKD